jgi:hypothetical protein
MEKEIWKDIINFEGFYQVSNIGRVRGLDRKAPHHKSGTQNIKGRLLKFGNNNGYMSVILTNNRKRENYLVHRLVAIHFISNPENKKEVNHINADKSDNTSLSLEWVTAKENAMHAVRLGLKNPANFWAGKSGFLSSRGTHVTQLTLNGMIVNRYGSASDAAKAVGCDSSGILKATKGIYKQYVGFTWIKEPII